MKYKIGQKVKIINNTGTSYFDRCIGTVATIVGVEGIRYILDIKTEYGKKTSLWYEREFVRVKRLDKLKRILEK